MVILSGSDIVQKAIECETAVALGSFDAIHIGHTEIIKKAVEFARQHNLKSLVYMFEKSPKSVMNNDPCFVNTLKKRLEIMESLGVDYIVVEKFTDDYRKIPYTDFINRYIFVYLNTKFISVGFNFRFGYNGEGNSEILKNICEERKIKVHIQNCISFDNVVSTSCIKELIASGETEKCTKYLGREFTLCGKVLHGREIGRTIGFPTANIEIPKEQVVPCNGVYITQTKVYDRIYSSITNIGEKPTIGEYSANIETYIMNFNEKIYDIEIEISFIKKLRETVKFDNLDGLKVQLDKDKQDAIEYFKNLKSN